MGEFGISREGTKGVQAAGRVSKQYEGKKEGSRARQKLVLSACNAGKRRTIREPKGEGKS